MCTLTRLRHTRSEREGRRERSVRVGIGKERERRTEGDRQKGDDHQRRGRERNVKSYMTN